MLISHFKRVRGLKMHSFSDALLFTVEDLKITFNKKIIFVHRKI